MWGKAKACFPEIHVYDLFQKNPGPLQLSEITEYDGEFMKTENSLTTTTPTISWLLDPAKHVPPFHLI